MLSILIHRCFELPLHWNHISSSFWFVIPTVAPSCCTQSVYGSNLMNDLVHALMVETTGVEPVSKNRQLWLSTRLDDSYFLPTLAWQSSFHTIRSEVYTANPVLTLSWNRLPACWVQVCSLSQKLMHYYGPLSAVHWPLTRLGSESHRSIECYFKRIVGFYTG